MFSFLNNISLGLKVLLTPIITIFFLFILVIFSNQSLISSKKTLNDIVKIRFELYKASSNLLKDINLFHSTIYKKFSYVANNYDQSQVDEQQRIIKQLSKSIDTQIKTIQQASYLQEEEKKNIDNIYKAFLEYQRSVNDALDILSIDVGMSVPMLSVADEFFISLNTELNTINTNADNANSKSYYQAKDELNHTENILYALSAVALLISLVLTIFITRSIKQSIKQFQVGLNSFFSYLNKTTSQAQMIEVKGRDEIGKMSESVNQNILEIKEGIENDRHLVDDAIVIAKQAKQGFMKSRIQKDTKNPELHELKDVINEMLLGIENNIQQAMNVLLNYNNYNYCSKVDMTNMDGDLKAICSDINSLGETISLMLVENKKMGETLSTNADNIFSNVQKLTDSANRQAQSLKETTHAIETISSTIKDSGENIVQMTRYAHEVSNSVKTGQDLATKTATSMDEINEKTNAIADAITIIDQIAFQTNILSLNAAVEAATAGEAGKGFAVVAQEVRNLAARSAEAAREIKSLVEIATIKANDGKTISKEMIDGYNILNENINNTLTLIEDVSQSSKGQIESIQQINATVNILDHDTQQNASIAQSTYQVAEEMNDIADKVVQNTNNKEFDGK